MNTPVSRDLQRPLVGCWGPMAGGVHTFLSLSRPSLREQQGAGGGARVEGKESMGRPLS